jgi:hypothetical protein
VKEYDIFVPLTYNDGSPVEPRKFQALQQKLVDQFGGLTFFPQPNEGFWTMGDVTYRDEIVIYRVLSRKVRSARKFLSQLKKRTQAIIPPGRDLDCRTENRGSLTRTVNLYSLLVLCLSCAFCLSFPDLITC